MANSRPHRGPGAARAAAKAQAAVEVAPVPVVVRNVAGEALELTADGRSPVRALQRQIEEAWGHPALCQRLLLGSEVLRESEPLGEAVVRFRGDDDGAAGQPVLLMLVVSLEEAQRRLSAPAPKQRLDALSAFARAAPRGSRGTLATVMAVLCDESPEVRAAALRALPGLVVQHPDERAVAAAVERSGDPSAEVRRAALQALPALVGEARPPAATDAACARLADADADVVAEALCALEVLAPRADSQVIAAVCRHLRHKRPDVRATALKALAQLAPKGSDTAVAAAAEALDDRDASVRDAAQTALARLAPSDAERSVAAACARLLHGRAEARSAALRALTREAPLGDRRAVDALCAVLTERGKGPRVEALAALPSVALRGDDRAIAAALACLEDPRDEVRLAALRVLPSLALGRHAGAVAAVSALVGDRILRSEAQRALRVLSAPDDEEVRAPGPPPVYVARGPPGPRLLASSASEPALALQPRAAKAAVGAPPGGSSKRGPGLPCRNPFLAAAGLLLEGGDAPAWRVAPRVAS